MRLVEIISAELNATWKKFHALKEGDVERDRLHMKTRELFSERMLSRDAGMYATEYHEVPEGSQCYVQITYRFENRNCHGEFCFGSNYPLNDTAVKDVEKNSEAFLEYCRKEGRLIQGGDQVFMIDNVTNEEKKIF